MRNASTVPDTLYSINPVGFCRRGKRDAALEVNLAVCVPRFHPTRRYKRTPLTNVLINSKIRTGNGIEQENGLVQNLFFSI